MNHHIVTQFNILSFWCKLFIDSENSGGIRVNLLIVGAGSVGMLFGAYSFLSGYHVHFVTRTQQQAAQLSERGFFYKSVHNEEFHIRCEAYDHRQFMQDKLFTELDIDLVIVTVKQYHLQDILPLLNHIDGQCAVLFLMNGLGHHERLTESLSEPALTYYGLTQNGATRVSEHEVEERGTGHTIVGSMCIVGEDGGEPAESMQRLIEAYNEQGINMHYSPQIEVEMWRKCIINASINALTAIFNVPNGELVNDSHLQSLMKKLYDESAQLAYSLNHIDAQAILKDGQLWEDIKQVCRLTANNYSSMLQDVQSKRQTEIDAINGYFLEQAKNVQCDMPFHQFVYESIRYLQSRSIS